MPPTDPRPPGQRRARPRMLAGTPYLRFERHPPFAHLTVDRPEARNALTQAMYFGIRYAVRRVDADPDLAGLLLTGTGDVFIPGGDLGQRAATSGRTSTRHRSRSTCCRLTSCGRASSRSSPPSTGSARAAAADRDVLGPRGGERAGQLPGARTAPRISDTYYAQLLVRLIGPVRTRDLMFTGRRLTAAEALDWGLVSRVVPHDELVKTATGGAGPDRPDPHPRPAVISSGFLDQYVGLQDRIAFFDSLQRPESTEGFAAFIEKRSPSWVPGGAAPATDRA